MGKIVACIMILAMVLSVFSVPSLAEAAPRASELIASYSVIFTRSGRNLVATSRITATDIVDQIGISRFEIQEKRNGYWEPIRWTEDKYDYNAISHTYSLSYTGRDGYQYQAVAYFYVKDGSQSDTAEKTSTQQTIPET